MRTLPTSQSELRTVARLLPATVWRPLPILEVAQLAELLQVVVPGAGLLKVSHLWLGCLCEQGMYVSRGRLLAESVSGTDGHYNSKGQAHNSSSNILSLFNVSHQ